MNLPQLKTSLSDENPSTEETRKKAGLNVTFRSQGTVKRPTVVVAGVVGRRHVLKEGCKQSCHNGGTS